LADKDQKKAKIKKRANFQTPNRLRLQNVTSVFLKISKFQVYR